MCACTCLALLKDVSLLSQDGWGCTAPDDQHDCVCDVQVQDEVVLWHLISRCRASEWAHKCVCSRIVLAAYEAPDNDEPVCRALFNHKCSCNVYGPCTCSTRLKKDHECSCHHDTSTCRAELASRHRCVCSTSSSSSCRSSHFGKNRVIQKASSRTGAVGVPLRID